MVHVATAALICFVAPISRGQEVALPEASPSPGREPLIPPEAATPVPTIPPPLLIPADVLPMPDPSAPPVSVPPGATLQELDEVLKPKSISEAAENYRKLIEWRRLRNRAQNDPVLKDAFIASERARTDLEKRRLLARYFDMLFDKEIALGAPDMKDYINDRRRAFLGALPQPRVRPEAGAKAESKRHAKAAAGGSAGEAAASSVPTPSPTVSPPEPSSR